MGHSGNNLTAKLAQKDEQIASLETRIQAYSARTAHIHARLLSTLDTLDVMQATHALEMSTVLKGKARLEDKLDRYVAVVRAAVVERDDMRDAVLKLVEKVEVSNDYSTWPHSCMQLTSLAEDPISEQPRRPVDEEELLNYAARIIESLRHEHDTERASHQRTREICEARLCALEAQLSRREAELEAYVRVPTLQHGVSTPQLRPLPVDVMTDDEAIRMLEMTATRNRALEVEIKTLFKRLDQARSAASPPPRFSSSDTSQRPPHFPPPETSQLHPPSERRRPPPQDDDSTLPEDTTIRPTLREDLTIRPPPEDIPIRLTAAEELDRQIAVLGKTVEAFRRERDELKRVIAGEKERVMAGGKVKEPVEPPADRPQVEPSIDRLATLEEECSRLRQSEEALRSELAASQAREKRAGPMETSVERLAALEEECTRLRQSEETLRSEVAATKTSSQTRENELLSEIYSLRRTISEGAVIPQTSPPLYPSHTTYSDAQTSPPPPQHEDHHLLEPEEGEVSMELATPLIPTSAIATLPRSRSHSRSPRVTDPNDSRSTSRLHSPDTTHHTENITTTTNANIDFGSPYLDPPSLRLPLSPPIDYLTRRERNSLQAERDSPSSSASQLSTFPNLSLSAFPLPPSSAAVPLPPSLSRNISRDREFESVERLGRVSDEERGCGERGERLNRELDGVQGMLGQAGVALGEIRAGLDELDSRP